MHAILYGVNRDQLMAKHKANHMHFVYADNAEMARKLFVRKVAFCMELGIQVNICGNFEDELENHQPARYRK